MNTDASARVRDGIIIVRAPHRLVAGNRQAMKEHLRSLLADEWGTVVLNCSGTVAIDSSAIGALCSVCMRAKETGQNFVLAELNDDFRTLLSETKLDTLFRVADEVPPGEMDTWTCLEAYVEAPEGDIKSAG